jgi:hypothetical protein
MVYHLLFLLFMFVQTGNKPSSGTYNALVVAFLLYSVIVGYYAATRPSGIFQTPFSWHPLLMTCGMIGCMGIAALTKKMGGYTNTKNHGLLANLGIFLSLGGLYAIYSNKTLHERPHFTSYHGQAGLGVLVCSFGAGMVGGVLLHPDFGLDKTNGTIRLAHKTFARIVLGCAWMTAFMGLYTLTQNPMELALFGVPLVIFAKFALI